MSFVDLTDFPSIFHLVPWSKASSEDSYAPSGTLDSLIGERVLVLEKADGANVGLTVQDGQVILRNRNRVLNQSHKTKASFQYGPLWNWAYARLDALSDLCEGGRFGVYGEWCYVRNTVIYDQLPDHLLSFDLRDLRTNEWEDVEESLRRSEQHGVRAVRAVWDGVVKRDFEGLLADWVQQKSFYSSTDRREGVVVRVLSGPLKGERYKVVRSDYQGGRYWSSTSPILQGLA